MRCDRHTWDTDDKEWCWKCEELKYEKEKIMVTLNKEHFNVQIEQGSQEELFYLLQENEKHLELKSFKTSDGYPDLEFIKYSSLNNLLPVAKKK